MYFIIPYILKTWGCVLLLAVNIDGGGLAERKDQNNQVNMVDSAGMKQGYWVIKEKERKVEEGVFVNNLKEGIWRAYYHNNMVKHEITFVGGKARGKANFYYEDGTLRESGDWQVDHWEGSYKYYFQSGDLAYDWFYNDEGKRQGKQIYFYNNGKTMYEGQWEDGKTVGALKVFNEEGILVQEKVFENGQFVIIKESTENQKSARPKFRGTGFHTIYNLSGQVEEKGFFVKGSLFNGQKYHYNEQGEPTSITTYTNGVAVDSENQQTILELGF